MAREDRTQEDGERRLAFGLPFDAFDLGQAIAALAQRPPRAPFAFVVTPNVDHIVRLYDTADPTRDRFLHAYRTARWRLCDSRVLAALAALRKIELPVAPGSDLTARLFAEAVRPQDVLCVVGADSAAVDILRQRHPEVTIVHHDPPMGLRDDPDAMADCVAFIERSHARFTFLAVGSPQQEMIAAAVSDRGAATGIGLCIGTSIDFLTGRVRRAPLMMQRMGLEWLHRLMSDPKRLWRRYLIRGRRIFRIALLPIDSHRTILD